MKFLNLILLGIMALPGAALAQGHSGHGQPPAPAPAPAPAAPRSEEARSPVDVPPEQQARMGLKTSVAEKRAIQHSIRTVGTVSADQRLEAHVHTRLNGWIEQIFADFIGKPVKRGQPLFELYSPDLVSTQEEYLAARSHSGTKSEIAKAALDRLKLWGVPASEIERLTKTGKSRRTISFESPVDGYVVNKTAIRGMYVTPDMELYHIADLSRIWVIVTLYEYDVAAIQTGDTARIELPYDPSKRFTGKISYIYPEIEAETRTARARIEIANPDLALKPGMFANVEISKNLGEAITVPDDAVIDTGTRRIVFVKTGASRFEPREVRVGPRLEGSFAILSGLKAGDTVVTSAHFLIDAESKFQAALSKGGQAPQSGHQGHGK